MADANSTQAIFSKLCENRKMKESASKLSALKESRKTGNTRKKNFAAKALAFEGVQHEGTEEIMDDVMDNVTVVIDPEKDVDDLEVRADAIQDEIDKTPEGEIAFSDEYIGDTIYACPVCGESFFADDTYQEGDACPICKAEPSDGFLNQGVVIANEADDEIPEAPINDDTYEDVDEGDESASEYEDEDTEPEDDEVEEAYRRRTARSNRRLRENSDKIYPDDKCKDCLEVALDEESFECLMNEFAKENYRKSIRRIKATEAVYNYKTDRIRVECKVFLRRGGTTTTVFEFKEGAADHNRAVFEAREITNVFGARSNSTPFKFNVRRRGNRIKFESLKYNYKVSARSGKTYQVNGRNTLREAALMSTHNAKGIEQIVKDAITAGVKKGAKTLINKGYEINTAKPYESLCADMGIKEDTIPKSAAFKWMNQEIDTVEFDPNKFALVAEFSDGKTRTFPIDDKGNIK